MFNSILLSIFWLSVQLLTSPPPQFQSLSTPHNVYIHNKSNPNKELLSHALYKLLWQSLSPLPTKVKISVIPVQTPLPPSLSIFNHYLCNGYEKNLAINNHNDFHSIYGKWTIPFCMECHLSKPDPLPPRASFAHLSSTKILCMKSLNLFEYSLGSTAEIEVESTCSDLYACSIFLLIS